MIKLVLKSKDKYSNYILESNDKTYEVNINFMNIELPSIGDTLYIPEKVLKEKVSLNYSTVDNSNIDEEELMVIVKNNNKIYMQRYYG